MTKTKCELKYLKKTAQLGHMLRKNEVDQQKEYINEIKLM
jgi:hypothetical protein